MKSNSVRPLVVTSFVLMFSSAMVWSTAATPSNPQSCGPKWTFVPSPNGSSGSDLNGVAALGRNDAWAVGAEPLATDPFIQRWDGTAWKFVADPPAQSLGLTDVAAVASDDVWAVGGASSTIGGPLIEHWNGTSWALEPGPSMSGGYLQGVAAVSTSDVWAVGLNFAAVNETVAEHWNGSTWIRVSTPDPGSEDNSLEGVAAVAANDVWAVGWFGAPSGNDQTLVLHWNGTTWSIVPSPNVGSETNRLFGVTAAGPTDLWAVGEYYVSGQSRTLAMRWDGSTWTVSPTPSKVPGTNRLLEAAVAANGQVWAVGYYEDARAHSFPISLRWDGATWTLFKGTLTAGSTGSFRDVAASPDGDLWAVGQFRGSSGTDKTLTERLCP